MKLNIDAAIAALEAKKVWILKGISIAEEAGYDTEDSKLEDAVTKAYERSSYAHAIEMGDDYKPFDPDFNYPHDPTFKSFVVENCRIADLAKQVNVIAELKKIDPEFEGTGTPGEVFNVLSAALQKQDPELRNAVREFRKVASASVRQDVRDIGSRAGQILDLVPA